MAEEKRGDPKVMWAVYGLAQLAGVSAVICTVAWLMTYRCHPDADGVQVCGYAWQSDSNLQFSWHPTLMILSMIYLYGNGETSNDANESILSLAFNPIPRGTNLFDKRLLPK